MYFVVIGTGGIGGDDSARLQAHGERVSFIARGTHLQVLQTRGLRADHPERRFKAAASAYSQERFLQNSAATQADLTIPFSPPSLALP